MERHDLDLLQSGFEFLYIARNDHDVCALLCKQLPKAKAEPLRASGDYDGLFTIFSIVDVEWML